MSDSQEIEVEVVEVVDKLPSTQPSRPSQSAPRHKQPAADGSQRPGSQRPFGRGIPIRSLRIPVYLWPLAIIFGLVLFLLAICVGILIAIPFLIIRAIYRLLFAPSR